MRMLLLFSVLAFSLFASAQERKSFHVTRVEAGDQSSPLCLGKSCIVEKAKVWGYTDSVEYVLSCSEVLDEGASKPRVTCSPMNAGKTYEVAIFPTVIGFPPEESPTRAWYMIRSEKERSPSKEP